MRKISNKLKKILKEEVTTLAFCIKFSLKNGEVLGFTNGSNDLVIDGITYLANSGFNASALEINSALTADNIDIEAVIDNKIIKEEDIDNGRFDFADITFFLIDQENDGEQIILKQGYISEITRSNNKFYAAIKGVTQKLKHNSTNTYSPLCRVKFAGKECGLDLKTYSFRGEVTEVISKKEFIDYLRYEEAGYFNNGIITFLSGNNKNHMMEVKNYSNSVIKLVMDLPYDIEIGDEYEITAGCLKDLNSCISKFNNAINFRGEPHIPGLDKLFATEQW